MKFNKFSRNKTGSIRSFNTFNSTMITKFPVLSFLIPVLFILFFNQILTANTVNTINSTDADTLDSSQPSHDKEFNRVTIMENYGKLPLQFEINRGQTDSQVQYLSRNSFYNIYFLHNEVVMTLPYGSSDNQFKTRKYLSAVLRMQFTGADNKPEISGRNELNSKINYLIGNNADKWNTNIPTFSKIAYREIYPGIDLVFHGNKGRLEYDFIVSPGIEPSTIKYKFDGADKIETDHDGNLVIDVKGTIIKQQKPVSYQEINGVRQNVFSRYIFDNESNTVSFQVASYDKKHVLVIDPVITYSKFIGGERSDRGIDIAVDHSKNVYILGETFSNDFPITGKNVKESNSDIDAFVTKLDSSGSVTIYSTYLGGSLPEFGLSTQFGGIAVDAEGNAIVTGVTASVDFPVVNAAQETRSLPGRLVTDVDAFVSKLNKTGSTLIYSTYLGGQDNDEGRDVAIDSTGNAYITGITASNDFPVTTFALDNKCGVNTGCSSASNQTDLFITKLNPAGKLVHSTYLGGDGGDWANGIAIDASDDVYITGVANFNSTQRDFPLLNAFQTNGNTFVTKVNLKDIAIVYSTLLGGSGDDSGYDIAVTPAGNAIVTGITHSGNFPLLNPFQQTFGGEGDAFITKFSLSGNKLLYSSYLGGAGLDAGHSIAVDIGGNALVTGITNSNDFPLEDAIQLEINQRGGSNDAFVTKIDSNGKIDYSTYLGGIDDDAGNGIAVDENGGVYITGYTESAFNFPKPDPLEGSGTAGVDAFVVKISDTSNLPAPTPTPKPVSNPSASITPTPAPIPIEGLKQLTFNTKDDYDPAWAPTGDTIAFASNRDKSPTVLDIWAIKSDGSNERQFVKGLDGGNGIGGSINWLGTTGDMVINEMVGLDEYMRFKLSEIPKPPVARKITDGNDDNFIDLLVVHETLGGGAINASKDGTQIAWQVRTSANKAVPVQSEIRVATLSELTGVDAATEGTLIVKNTDGLFQGVSFSPDGNKVVVSKNGNLIIYNTTGSIVEQITSTGADSNPEWSKQNRIIYDSTKNGNADIFIINPDGSGHSQITSGTDNDITPTWSPEGRKIAFSSDRSGNSDIWTIGVKGVVVPPQPTPTPDSTPVDPGTKLSIAGTIEVPNPVGVGINHSTNLIYISSGERNSDSGDLSNNSIKVINGKTKRITNSIVAGKGPAGIGVNTATNIIYAANNIDGTVSVIDGSKNEVVVTVNVSSSPFSIGVNSETNLIYIGDSFGSTITVMDGLTNQILTTTKIEEFRRPAIGINELFNLIYVTNENIPGNVSVIDGTTNKVSTTISVGEFPTGIAVNSTTNRIYVYNNNSTLHVIEGATNQIADTITGLPDTPGGVGVNSVTNHIFIATLLDGNVIVIDGTSHKIIKTFKVSDFPDAIGVNPQTNLVYVINRAANLVTVIQDAPTTIAKPTPAPVPTIIPTITPPEKPTPVPTKTDIGKTPIPVSTPLSDKSFTLKCNKTLVIGNVGLDKLVLKSGNNEACVLQLTNFEPGIPVEISTNIKTGVKSSIKVTPENGITDINGELEFTISAIKRGVDWIAWAVPDETGEFQFNKRAYDKGTAWGMFVEVK